MFNKKMGKLISVDLQIKLTDKALHNTELEFLMICAKYNVQIVSKK